MIEPHLKHRLAAIERRTRTPRDSLSPEREAPFGLDLCSSVRSDGILDESKLRGLLFGSMVNAIEAKKMMITKPGRSKKHAVYCLCFISLLGGRTA